MGSRRQGMRLSIRSRKTAARSWALGIWAFTTPLTPQARVNSWWTYGCVQGMQQRYGYRFNQEQLKGYCQCRDRGKRSSEECQHHLGIPERRDPQSKFSNQEEFAIGAITSVICGKRLGKIDDKQGNKVLVSSLVEQNFPVALATNQSLWLEAYRNVGEGLELCKANQ
jgi:hypothetical protein